MSEDERDQNLTEKKGKGATSSLTTTSNRGMHSTPTFHIKPPSQLNIPEGQSAAKQWKLWKQMWENYVVVTNLSTRDNNYQKAVFLCTIGQPAMEIFNSFQYNADEDPNDMKTIIKKFDEHFTGEINETYERFQFNKRI